MAIIDFDDDERRRRGQFPITDPPVQQEQPEPPPNLAPTPISNPRDDMIARDAASWEKSLREAGGSLYHPSDLEGVIRNVSYAQNAGRDPADFIKAAQEQYRARAANSRGTDANVPGAPAGTPRPQPGPSGPSGPSAPQAFSPNVPAQFSDPITKFLEQIAQDRAQRLENPPAGSGQSLLEDALKRISAQFEQGGYTPAEQEIFQTQALDPHERLRTARRQQVMERLSRRGISPNSGIALQMLQDVDRQFDQSRTMLQRDLAGNIANERTARMMKAIEMLSGLAGGENRRLDQAFQYRTVPLNLADRAFSQGLQVSDRAFDRAERTADRGFANAMNLLNTSGNPLALAGPFMNLQNLQQGRQQDWQEALGYLAGILSGGRR